MIEWDARQYSLFVDERSEPNIDLISKLPVDANKIADLGCGAGDCSTFFLRQRYKNAEILAVDSSPSIIRDARMNSDLLNVQWMEGGIEEFDAGAMDLIYMGSVFQWVKNHDRNLKRLIKSINRGGCIALHMPYMFNKPFYKSIIKISKDKNWRDLLRDKLRVSPVLTPGSYESILKNVASSYKIWTTTYFHSFPGVSHLLEWAKGAPLRPVSSLLTLDLFDEFCLAYAKELSNYYMNKDGSCTLPFERIFMIAKA